MKKYVIAVALLALGSSSAFADAIKERRDLMKATGAATKALVPFAKGEAPFDAAAVKVQLEAYVNSATKFGALFPDDSKSGGDTTASPKIWEDKAGFQAAIDKFLADTNAAMAATDTASFGAAFGKVTGNCQSCHEVFRVKKS